jgi:oligopeptide/dipeptide ABC transporter ATP-binding protein
MNPILTQSQSDGVILEAKQVTKQFTIGGLLTRNRRIVHALSNVSFSIAAGETVAIVGESGCGKSTLARCLLHLIEPTSGSVMLDGMDASYILSQDPSTFRRAVQIVFQDPYASLNPRRTIGQSLDDPLRIFGMKDRARRWARIIELLRLVGLPGEFAHRYPHELSGGQRQRVAIARALAPNPRVIVCDEAVSALDVSVQAQIINLLRDIQDKINVAYVFITHNLHLVRRIADRVAIMYLGEIVEMVSRNGLLKGVAHPYSRALFSSAPVLNRDPHAKRQVPAPALKGEVPSPIDLPSGCRFHPRCPYRQPLCSTTAPQLQSIQGRDIRCHFAVQMLESGVSLPKPKEYTS